MGQRTRARLCKTSGHDEPFFLESLISDLHYRKHAVQSILSGEQQEEVKRQDEECGSGLIRKPGFLLLLLLLRLPQEVTEEEEEAPSVGHIVQR